MMTTCSISDCVVAVSVGVWVAIGRPVAVVGGVGVEVGLSMAAIRLLAVGKEVGLEVGVKTMMRAEGGVGPRVNVACGRGKGVGVETFFCRGVCSTGVGVSIITWTERGAKFVHPTTRMTNTANIASVL